MAEKEKITEMKKQSAYQAPDEKAAGKRSTAGAAAASQAPDEKALGKRSTAGAAAASLASDEKVAGERSTAGAAVASQAPDEKTPERKQHINVEKRNVGGIQVKTYSVGEGADTVYKVKSEAEMEQDIKDYEEKKQLEAEQKLREREEKLKAQLEHDLEDNNFETGEIPAAGAADAIKLDPEKIQESLAKIVKDDRIACIGDSITYGFEVEGSLTWIAILRREEEINLLNVGINGDTTASMVERFHEHVVDLSPKAVLIMGGGNDIMGGTPLDYVTNNVAMMSQMALDRGIVPMIGITPEPYHKEVPKEWKVMMDYDATCEVLATYKQWLITFAKANLLPLIDFDTGMKNKLRAGYGRYFMDGVHPNPAGHKIMAQIAKEAFQKMGLLAPEPEPVDDRFAL